MKIWLLSRVRISLLCPVSDWLKQNDQSRWFAISSLSPLSLLRDLFGHGRTIIKRAWWSRAELDRILERSLIHGRPTRTSRRHIPPSQSLLLLCITFVVTDPTTLALPTAGRRHISTHITQIGPTWVSRHSYGTPLWRITLLVTHCPRNPIAYPWRTLVGGMRRICSGDPWVGLGRLTTQWLYGWVKKATTITEPTLDRRRKAKSCSQYTQVVWASTTNLGWASVEYADSSTYIMCMQLLSAWKRVRRTILLTIGIDTEYSPGIVRRQPCIADFDPFKDFQCCCPTTFRIMGVSSIVSINGA
jgi:hypothetical protein